MFKSPPLGVIMLIATAGLAGGCLVFSDPVNTPPVVDISDPGMVHVNVPVTLVATANDPGQDAAHLTYHWFRSPGPCHAGGAQDAPVSVMTQYVFVAETFDPVCVIVNVTDKYGATATAARTMTPQNRNPVAVISLVQQEQAVTVSNLDATTEFPLFFDLRLTAAGSTDPDGDPLTYTWTITDPSDTVITPPPCADTPDHQDVCWSLLAPGSYVITLTVADDKIPTPATHSATFAFTVADDHPPCFVAGSPQIARVPRAPEQPARFSIDEVWDDGDPYPPARADQQNGFRWLIRVNDQPWQRLGGYNLPYFDIHAGTHDTGDVVKIRVDILDRVERRLHEQCSDEQDQCSIADPPRHAPNTLTECLQRYTWTVEYRL